MKTLEAAPIIHLKAKRQSPTNGPQVLEAINPATGGVIGTVPITSATRIPEMIAGARKAQETWSRLTFEQRAGALEPVVNFGLGGV